MNNGMQGFSRRSAAGTPKPIQRGTINIAGGASSGTATIAAVSDKAIVIPGGVRGTGSTSVDDFMVTVVLTNSTTVTAQRGGSPAMNVIVAYQVQDFY